MSYCAKGEGYFIALGDPEVIKEAIDGLFEIVAPGPGPETADNGESYCYDVVFDGKYDDQRTEEVLSLISEKTLSGEIIFHGEDNELWKWLFDPVTGVWESYTGKEYFPGEPSSGIYGLALKRTFPNEGLTNMELTDLMEKLVGNEMIPVIIRGTKIHAIGFMSTKYAEKYGFGCGPELTTYVESILDNQDELSNKREFIFDDILRIYLDWV